MAETTSNLRTYLLSVSAVSTIFGVHIYVDRKDGQGFVYLANDSQPDYLDTFPVPAGVASAVWEYKAIYRIGDDQVGQFSEAVKVTVTKQTGY